MRLDEGKLYTFKLVDGDVITGWLDKVCIRDESLHIHENVPFTGNVRPADITIILNPRHVVSARPRG
jgi:hypothetical protein